MGTFAFKWGATYAMDQTPWMPQNAKFVCGLKSPSSATGNLLTWIGSMNKLCLLSHFFVFCVSNIASKTFLLRLNPNNDTSLKFTMLQISN